MDPNRALSQYPRQAWDAERGFPGGAVQAITQGGDGYLWIGSEKGLVRFDGVEFRLRVPPGHHAQLQRPGAGAGDGCRREPLGAGAGAQPPALPRWSIRIFVRRPGSGRARGHRDVPGAGRQALAHGPAGRGPPPSRRKIRAAGTHRSDASRRGDRDDGSTRRQDLVGHARRRPLHLRLRADHGGERRATGPQGQLHPGHRRSRPVGGHRQRRRALERSGAHAGGGVARPLSRPGSRDDPGSGVQRLDRHRRRPPARQHAGCCSTRGSGRAVTGGGDRALRRQGGQLVDRRRARNRAPARSPVHDLLAGPGPAFG